MLAVQEPPTSSNEMTALLNALVALKKGKCSVRLPVEWTGIVGKVADAFNDVVELNERMSSDLARMSQVVGKEGKLHQRLSVGEVSGFWSASVQSVNDLIDDLVHPTSETARVIGAVAQGDLSHKMALEVDDRPLQGEFLRTAQTTNKMVEQLGAFTAEVTRVAREVGTEGKLGGQAQVKGLAGIWKELTDSVNSMAGHLTSQVRNIADVTKAVANGDLSVEKQSIGMVLNTIEANMRTEGLLQQSQSLAQQLQARQEQLEQTNEELQEKAHLLAQQNQEVERKNSEVEQARQKLEEKAKQLALTSKYKSEFLANMSHELRTPLNSLLILSDQLSKNQEGNLNLKQTEFAKTIHSSGNELLMLINDILDLSKIESGTVLVDASELRLNELHGYVERTFRHVGEAKNVAFKNVFSSVLPALMFTDAKRLQQIIKNLLSNAFKFTQQGQVSLSVVTAETGWSLENEDLNRATEVVAFAVSDTGIGIPFDKQQIIFEAFQQADGSTSRKYGGTGLGLAISRELSRLLGGEIRLISVPGQGSTFTLYLPTIDTNLRSGHKSAQLDRLPAPVAKPVAKSTMQKRTDSRNGSENSTLDAFMSMTEVEPAREQISNEVSDDRDDIGPGDRVLLIIENDPDESSWKRLAHTCVVHRSHSLDRLQDLVALSLHRNVARLSKSRRQMLEGLHYSDQSLDGKKVLIVDDDMRNIFALSTVLEDHNMVILSADNGRDAIKKLEADEGIDIVLMDIMMPEMNGMETMREIRKINQLKNLPIVAVTAKAMKGDREKCIEAGAWDYLSKPVDPERMLAVLRAWLQR